MWPTYGKSGIGLDDNHPNSTESCISVTNNLIRNVVQGASLGINKTLFKNNVINYFGDDAIDYYADDLTISHNLITNAVNISDAMHADMMQGQIGRLDSASSTEGYSNDTIDGNTVIRQTDPTLAFPDYVQGIDNFDMNLTNLTVTNNIVITDMGDGLTFSSVHGALIANNVVLRDGDTIPHIINGDPSAGGYDVTPGSQPALGVSSLSHEGTASDGVITVSNNIADVITTDFASATLDHNMAASYLNIPVGGVLTWYNTPGTYSNTNIINPNFYSGFANLATSSVAVLAWDLNLLPTSPAIGIGSVLAAPTYDIAGTLRVPPIALGAYTSSYYVPLVVSTPSAQASDLVTPINFTTIAANGVSPYTYHWDFGDASSSTSQNPAHLYASGGTFTAVLRVTDSISNVAYATSTVTITANYDASAISIFNSWAANSCAISMSEKGAVNNWVLSSKSNGTFSKLASVFFLQSLGGCSNKDAYTNWITPSSLATPSGTVTCTNQDCQSSGGVIDTGVSVASAGGSQNNIAFGAYLHSNPGAGISAIRAGTLDTLGGSPPSSASATINTYSGGAGTFGTAGGLTTAPFPGGFGVSRNGSTTTFFAAEKDGSSQSVTTTSTVVPDGSTFTIGYNNTHTAFSFISTSTSVTDLANILTDAYNYLTAIGAQ